MSTIRCLPFADRRLPFAVFAIALAALVSAPPTWSQTTTPPPAQPAQQQDQTPPAAGGPGADNGAIALPKKKETDEAPPPAPAEPKFKNPPGTPNYSLQVQVPEVTVDVGVLLEKTGQFVPGLKPDNFRVYENGVEQKVIGFRRVEAPITALLLCEFAAPRFNSGYITAFNFDMLNAAYSFAQQLRPQDYVALMTFDLRAHIITDFTQDKSQIQEAINSLAIGAASPAAFSEKDLFDALYEAEDRLSRIQGRKYIILVASGIDTFSKITLDKILQKVKSTPDITIFAISTGGALRAMTEGGPGMDAGMRDIGLLQADNQMKTFAKLTGGMWFEPRFEAEMPDIFSDINQAIRSKYELIYRPSDTKQDGTYRKLRVELVDDEGKPLRIQDQKHKPLKYEIIARDGYRARQEVE